MKNFTNDSSIKDLGNITQTTPEQYLKSINKLGVALRNPKELMKKKVFIYENLNLNNMTSAQITKRLLNDLRHFKDSNKDNGDIENLQTLRNLFASFHNFESIHIGKAMGSRVKFVSVIVEDERRLRIVLERENGNIHKITVSKMIQRLSLGSWRVEKDLAPRKKMNRIPLSFR